MIFDNPELRKNFILEMTTLTVVGVPLAIGVILVSASLATNPLNALGASCGWIVGLAILFGAFRAAQALPSEIRDGTWDFQRMTGLSPWKMTLGKLFGSSIVGWYALLFTLPVTFYVTSQKVSESVAITTVACIVLEALLIQLIALQSTALNANFVVGRNPRRLPPTVWLVVVVLMAWPVVGIATTISKSFAFKWWNLSIDSSAFIPLSLLVFSAWALLGAQRAVCRSMRVQARPGAWPLFLIFVILYLSGFNSIANESIPGLISAAYAFVAMIVLSYIALLSEHVDMAQWRRFFQALRNENWYAALTAAPLWLSPLILAIVSGVIITAAGIATNDQQAKQIALSPIVIMLFAARDATIYATLTARSSPGRSSGRQLALVFFLLYVGLPWLFKALGLHFVAAMFWPYQYTEAGPFSAVIPPLVVLAVTIALCLRLARRPRVRGAPK